MSITKKLILGIALDLALRVVVFTMIRAAVQHRLAEAEQPAALVALNDF